MYIPSPSLSTKKVQSVLREKVDFRQKGTLVIHGKSTLCRQKGKIVINEKDTFSSKGYTCYSRKRYIFLQKGTLVIHGKGTFFIKRVAFLFTKKV